MLHYTTASAAGPVVLLDDVLSVFDRFRQRRRWQKEAGGQLFARFEGSATVIVEATPPSRFDLRRRTFFEPQRATQQREIEERFRQGLHFVGDWHSHPEIEPVPSSLDIASMKECLRRSRHDLKALVLIIVGARFDAENLWAGIVTTKSTLQLVKGEASIDVGENSRSRSTLAGAQRSPRSVLTSSVTSEVATNTRLIASQGK